MIRDDLVIVILVVIGFQSVKSVLIGAGVIGPLVWVLECGCEVGLEGSVCVW